MLKYLAVPGTVALGFRSVPVHFISPAVELSEKVLTIYLGRFFTQNKTYQTSLVKIFQRNIVALFPVFMNH